MHVSLSSMSDLGLVVLYIDEVFLTWTDNEESLTASLHMNSFHLANANVPMQPSCQPQILLPMQTILPMSKSLANTTILPTPNSLANANHLANVKISCRHNHLANPKISCQCNHLANPKISCQCKHLTITSMFLWMCIGFVCVFSKMFLSQTKYFSMSVTSRARLPTLHWVNSFQILIR